jgi:hypothetical protein
MQTWLTRLCGIGFIWLAGAFGAAAAAQDTQNKWNEWPLAQGNGLKATLRVLREASLVDEQWLRIEIDNAGADMGVSLAGYRIELTELTDAAGKPVAHSTTLGMGNSFDFFPYRSHASPREPAGTSNERLPVGKSVFSANPSNFAAQELGTPPSEGAHVGMCEPSCPWISASRILGVWKPRGKACRSSSIGSRRPPARSQS